MCCEHYLGTTGAPLLHRSLRADVGVVAAVVGVGVGVDGGAVAEGDDCHFDCRDSDGDDGVEKRKERGGIQMTHIQMTLLLLVCLPPRPLRSLDE